MKRSPILSTIFVVVVVVFVTIGSTARSHEHTQQKAERQREVEPKSASTVRDFPARQPRCAVTLKLRDDNGQAFPAGLIRVTDLDSKKEIPVPEGIHRASNWYTVSSSDRLTVPQARIRIEAVHGLVTERGAVEVDLIGHGSRAVEILLKRINSPASRGLRAGNTHLHLMKMTYLEALRYLEVVPRSDGLDLVFLSHLRRIPDEKDYVSNQIVENSFQGGDLERLSQHGVAYGTGEEHRHNFGRGGEGYGHVMLLDLMRLVEPVSIGPGIMAGGSDGLPLQVGIRTAREQGATVIWCHNTFGYEDIPNWAAGLLHAQNIHDGGEHGSYEDTYYRYLNLGLHVPFSTGTDWFVYDFSRVYVPVPDAWTRRQWLAALSEGKSYITNGPLLEFTVNGRSPGDTISDSGPLHATIRGRAVGRHDFGAIELIHNGEVVQSAASEGQRGHFQAEREWTLRVEDPGWFALRIATRSTRNELGNVLFAHTSPVYFEPGGRRIFRSGVARELIAEIESNLRQIEKQGQFATPAERDRVLGVHRVGIQTLTKRLDEQAR